MIIIKEPEYPFTKVMKKLVGDINRYNVDLVASFHIYMQNEDSRDKRPLICLGSTNRFDYSKLIAQYTTYIGDIDKAWFDTTVISPDVVVSSERIPMNVFVDGDKRNEIYPYRSSHFLYLRETKEELGLENVAAVRLDKPNEMYGGDFSYETTFLTRALNPHDSFNAIMSYYTPNDKSTVLSKRCITTSGTTMFDLAFQSEAIDLGKIDIKSFKENNGSLEIKLPQFDFPIVLYKDFFPFAVKNTIIYATPIRIKRPNSDEGFYTVYDVLVENSLNGSFHYVRYQHLAG